MPSPSPPTSTRHTTACPRNCYSTCTMTVEVEDGRVRRIEAHPGNRATPEGPCLKGLSYVERQISPERILHPLRRQKDGSFQPVSWDEALAEIAGELRRVRERWGPQAVFYYAASGTKGLLNGAGSAFFRLFGGMTTTYGDLCWPAGLEAGRLTLGANKHNAPWDLAHARLIVLWAKNPAETNIHQMPFIEQALAAGARLVVIDPRRTESAERAHVLIQPRPGTDGALALGVAHLLCEREQLDRSFVERHVLGFDAFRERVREFPPERVAAICEIPAAAVERLAELFGTIRPATICVGYGGQRYTNSGQAMRAILALVALTGNLGKQGAGWQFANLQTAIFDSVPDPVAFYPPEGWEMEQGEGRETGGEVRVAVSTARLGREMLSLTDPPLRFAWVERGNPATQNPETNTVLAAFRALDFRVVVDQFLTDTAREADLVLPAKTLFEQSDVIGAYWHPYLQLRQKLVEPPGQVKPETEIYRLLADRLGLPREEVDAAIPGPGDREIEAWLEAKLAPFPGLSLERLRQGPALAPGHQEIAFADGIFPTPSGKIELVSEAAARHWGVDPVPGYEEPLESPRRPSPEAAKYPLHLLTPNTRNRIHSQFGNLRMIAAGRDRPTASLHPADARRRGIAGGERVRIFNDRGHLEVEARLDAGLRPGCVVMTNGWWQSQGGTPNLCSLGRETDMGHGAAFHDNLVEVERAG